MAHNNYTYHVFVHDAAGMADSMALGFTMGGVSTDDNLCICDKRSATEETIAIEPTKPSYVTESMPNWPYLDHTEARQLTAYYATTNGGSDGWKYIDKS